jgi:5-methylcytosine-specific restriction endonuclease McrA
MAVHVTTARRAFALLYKERAEVVSMRKNRMESFDFESWKELSQFKDQFEEEAADYVRTISFEIRVPRIIRLFFYDKLPLNTVKLNRKNLFARDRRRCQYCGRKVPTSELSLDHIIPRSRRGKTVWENVVTCCADCNVKKGGRLPWEVGMRLVRKPTKPSRSPLIRLKVRSQRYKSWKQFVHNAYWSVELK